jgi:hypothetical protein
VSITVQRHLNQKTEEFGELLRPAHSPARREAIQGPPNVWGFRLRLLRSLWVAPGVLSRLQVSHHMHLDAIRTAERTTKCLTVGARERGSAPVSSIASMSFFLVMPQLDLQAEVSDQ